MQLAAVAVICSRFRLELAERMGGPEGVANSSINRLTLQPKVKALSPTDHVDFDVLLQSTTVDFA